MKRILKKVMTYMLTIAISFSATNVPINAQENVITETNESTGEKVFEGDNYKITFTLTSYWDTGYNANVKLTNTGKYTIQNWYLGFDYNDSITNIWNAEISAKNENKYIIKNAGWNQDIAAGNSIEFGISSDHAFKKFPENFKLIGTSTEVKDEDYTITYHVDSDWGSGFTSTITITNNTDIVLEDWFLEFNFNREIDSIWNGIIESHEGSHYTIRNAEYNSNIASGESISLGFKGYDGDTDDKPDNYLLYSYTSDTGTSMELDTDGDGMVDGVETILGLNYKSADTDGDGLNDYYEYAFCDLNPLSKDTDGDGILDNNEDEDNDGLVNELEYLHNTNPLIKDSDQDGLSDYDEIITYFTEPLCEDTDGDGLSDYDDVKLGFSPLKKDTDENGIPDSEEIINQIFEQEIVDTEKKAVTKVTIDMSTAGNIENTTSISNVYNIDKMSSDVVGLISVPVEINCSSKFEKATITFWYNKNELEGTNENDLAVMWYDKDNHCYKLLDEESVVNTETGTVSYTTTHFSTYMVVDRTKWYAAWKENLDYRTNVSDKTSFYDFAFVIDTSSSMSGNRISTAKEALKGFVEQLSPKDNACLIRFNSSAFDMQNFTNDKNLLNAAISKLYTGGRTNVNSGLVKALQLFDNQKNSDRKKAIILLCDGDVNYNKSTINKCIEKGISIYTVNVGPKSSKIHLKKMSEETGGEYYYCTSTDKIKEVFGLIQDATLEEIDATDTDGDGLFDVYETVGIRLENGRIIRTNPKLADTDGDGLTDYEEVGIIYSSELNIGTSLTIKGKYALMYSDPLLKDTDSDGKIDSEDEKPWTYDTVKNLLIYQSARPKGLNADGTVANDMKYGQTNRTDILAINDLFRYQLDEADSDYLGSGTLFREFEDMSTSLFSTGEMESVILNMISHFEDGTGSDYSNVTLTKAASEHQSTQKYVNDIKGEVIRRLTNNGGNIYDLEFTEEGNQTGKSIYNWAQQNISYPRFHENSDIINGLTICVNDTWGNTVEVKDYNFDGEHFSGTLHFCIYDHFGLDKPDVEKMYVKLAGFRAWYVLQHYEQFNGSYVPFVTLMEFDVPFEGNILMYKAAE